MKRRGKTVFLFFLMIVFLGCLVHCSKNKSNPVNGSANISPHSIISTWWMCGSAQINNTSVTHSDYSSTSIQVIMSIRSDTIISNFRETDTTWQRNRWAYTKNTDTIHLIGEIEEPTWVVSFSSDTLLYSESAHHDTSYFTFVTKWLAYTGPIPPANWGTFDPHSQHP
jgi:hypothetical protein